MKAKMIMGVLVVTVFVLAACGSVNNGEQDGGAALAGIHWVLLALDGQPPLVGTTITAEFSEEQITGVSGCNSYFGDYTIDGGKLQFDMIGMTAMACLEPEGVMAQESAYADLLQEVRSVRLDGAGADQRLELLDESGAVRLLYARQAIPASDPAELIGTQWELLTLDGSPLDADMRFTLAFEEDRYRGWLAAATSRVSTKLRAARLAFPAPQCWRRPAPVRRTPIMRWRGSSPTA